MSVWPLQFRAHGAGEILFSDDAGAFFKASESFLNRYSQDGLTSDDSAFLKRNGHSFQDAGDLAFIGFAARFARRLNPTSALNYVILVPTLRCNLMCDYCQVSRAAEDAKGFDWTEQQLDQVIALLDQQSTPHIKVEFQGGEPLLRLDLLDAVRNFCRQRFSTAEFVVCTNLQNVSAEAWRFLDADDTHVSTSFDGTADTHKRNRTKTSAFQNDFLNNLDRAIDLLGTDRVSALPTIDPSDPPKPIDIINSFSERGLTSIYLRRVNYQGFARKRYDFEQSFKNWRVYYRRFIVDLIAYNAQANQPLEEYYLSHALRRILQNGHHNHVDLRNPNWLGADYLVIDFDGRFYPTDEARMVSRIGRIDLSIGDLETGVNPQKVETLNLHASNLDDPDCVHCVYRPYCGLDLVDDLSRYGRIDVPRHQTEHCRTHLDLFDLAFELLYSEDENVHRSLAYWLGVPRFSPLLAPRLS